MLSGIGVQHWGYPPSHAEDQDKGTEANDTTRRSKATELKEDQFLTRASNVEKHHFTVNQVKELYQTRGKSYWSRRLRVKYASTSDTVELVCIPDCLIAPRSVSGLTGKFNSEDVGLGIPKKIFDAIVKVASDSSIKVHQSNTFPTTTHVCMSAKMGGTENKVIIKRIGKAQEPANIEVMFKKVHGTSMKANSFKCYGYIKFILKANIPQGTDVGKVEGWVVLQSLLLWESGLRIER